MQQQPLFLGHSQYSQRISPQPWTLAVGNGLHNVGARCCLVVEWGATWTQLSPEAELLLSHPCVGTAGKGCWDLSLWFDVPPVQCSVLVLCRTVCTGHTNERLVSTINGVSMLNCHAMESRYRRMLGLGLLLMPLPEMETQLIFGLQGVCLL